jgi:hypothetical protein
VDGKMPEIINTLTEQEKLIKQKILNSFSVEQICAYFLSKNFWSIYQFSDEFIGQWYLQFFGDLASDNKRTSLVTKYTKMLLVDHQYENHMKYWVRELQPEIFDEMNIFFRKTINK